MCTKIQGFINLATATQQRVACLPAITNEDFNKYSGLVAKLEEESLKFSRQSPQDPQYRELNQTVSHLRSTLSALRDFAFFDPQSKPINGTPQVVNLMSKFQEDEQKLSQLAENVQAYATPRLSLQELKKRREFAITLQSSLTALCNRHRSDAQTSLFQDILRRAEEKHVLLFDRLHTHFNRVRQAILSQPAPIVPPPIAPIDHHIQPSSPTQRALEIHIVDNYITR
jgi:hypothetical protein